MLLKFQLCFLLIFSITTLNSQPLLSLDDLENHLRIGNVSISKDGSTGIFTTTKRDFQSNRNVTVLHSIDIKTRMSKVISTNKGISQPEITPNGSSVSFIASSPKGRQLFLVSLTEEGIQQITNIEGGVIRYEWAPSGENLAVLTYETLPEPENEFNNSLPLGENDYLVDTPSRMKSIVIIDNTGKVLIRVLPESGSFGTGLVNTGLAWSNDEMQISATMYPSPLSGVSDLGRAVLINAESGEVDYLTSNIEQESAAAFSKDGKSIFYRYPLDGVPANPDHVYRKNLSTGKTIDITENISWNIRGFVELEKSQLLLSTIEDYNHGLRILKEGEIGENLLQEITGMNSFSVSKKGMILLAGTTPQTADELYLIKKLGKAPEKLTNFNEELSGKKHGLREGISWENGKLNPNGIVTYPPDFDETKKYPLVLFIHGGPTASSLNSYNIIAHIMAAKGWIVLQPNYRGSNNLGAVFQAAIANDPAEGPGEDVIKGVEFLNSKPYIDENRIAVSGWSYGGWMTSWLIGRYPDVWTAAVAGAAPVDFTDMYSLSDLNRMRRHSITVSPYSSEDQLKWALENSPLIHLPKVTTPTLIMSKTGDYRVSITGSYKLYGALRDNNVPVKFIGYPGPGHFPSDPVRYRDVYENWIEWLEKYL